MTKKIKFELESNKTTTAPQKKLTRAEKDEAFRLMNENWSKGMDLYLAAMEKQKAQEETAG